MVTGVSLPLPGQSLTPLQETLPPAGEQVPAKPKKSHAAPQPADPRQGAGRRGAGRGQNDGFYRGAGPAWGGPGMGQNDGFYRGAGSGWGGPLGRTDGFYGGQSWSSSGFGGGRGTNSRRLTISGSGSLSFRDWQVNGNSPTFSFDTPYRQRLTNQANLFINGPIYGDTYINASISRSTYITNRNRWRIIHEGNDAKVVLGDIDLRYADNEFIPFSRSLQGLQIETHVGPVVLNAFGSQIKGAVRRESFPGDGTGGPYYLRYRPIVEGSEVVTVDGERMRRGAEETGDYTLDTTSGALYFNSPRLIPPTSTISVSYETQLSGQQPGELFGIRAGWALGRAGQMGLTFIGQTAKSGGAGYRTWNEELIANDSIGPYHLLRTPLRSESEAIFVDGKRQQRGTDYRINYQSGVLEFARPVPSTSRISITYQYEVPSTQGGNRNILGLDGQYRLLSSANGRRDLMVHLQFANSSPGGAMGGSGYGGYYGGGYGGYYGGSYRSARQSSTTEETEEDSGGRGNALKIRLMGKLSDLEFSAEFKDISSRFSRIDSVGYFQNESGLNLNLGYRPASNLDFFLRYDRFRRPGYGSTASNLGIQQSLGLNWAPAGAPQFQLMRNVYKTTGGERSYSLVRDSLGLQYRRGALQVNGSFDRSQNQNQGDVILGGLQASTSSGRLSLSYDSQSWFNLRGDFALSNTSSASGTTRARNINLGLNLTPGSQWTITTTYQLSRSDGARSLVSSTSGSTTGTGETQDGEGTSRGTPLSRQFSSWGSSSYQSGGYGGYGSSYGSYGSSYGGYGSFYGGYGGYGSEYGGYGGYSYGGYAGSSGFGGFGGYNPYGNLSSFSTARTNTQALAIGVDWHPSPRFSLNLNFDRQIYDTSYYASATDSKNWSLGLMLTPMERISLNAQYSLQNMSYLDGSGGSDSNILYAGLRAGPFGRFGFNLDYQDLDSTTGLTRWGTGGGFGSTYGGTYGGYGSGWGSETGGFGSGYGGGFGSGSSGFQRNLSNNRSLTAGVQYRLTQRNSLFLRWQRSTNQADGSFGNFVRQALSLGFDYALTNFLRVRVSLDHTNYGDPTDSSRNYSANMLAAELGANF